MHEVFSDTMLHLTNRCTNHEHWHQVCLSFMQDGGKPQSPCLSCRYLGRGTPTSPEECRLYSSHFLRRTPYLSHCAKKRRRCDRKM
ncbi:unnamed protein product, partial [Ixodes persulcatus]